MTTEQFVGGSLILLCILFLGWAMLRYLEGPRQGSNSKPSAPSRAENQEIIFFEPSGKFVAAVNGVYLERNRQTGFVTTVAVIGSNVLQHHATFCDSRMAAEQLLEQWNAQKLRDHFTRTPYTP